MSVDTVHASLYGTYEAEEQAMGRRELIGWHAIGKALARWSRSGATYAAIPHELTARLGVSGYPMADLAPAIDPEGRFCGFDGFYRDDLAGVDWWCLLPYDHGFHELVLTGEDAVDEERIRSEGRHGWDRVVRCREWLVDGDNGKPVRARLVMAPVHVTIRDAFQVNGLRAELDDVGPELIAWSAVRLDDPVDPLFPR
jgi:hypothetical protein